MTAPDVLFLTPDFPPAHGGIQLLTHRVATSAHLIRPHVITLASAGHRSFDAASPRLDVRRTPRLPGPRALSMLGLNVGALLHGIDSRPRAILNGHIVTSPAAVALQRRLRIPLVQYAYARELGDRPLLSRWALRHAAATIAISGYTRGLVESLGADPATIHVIPPGVDLPAESAVRRDARPTLLTVARLAERYKGHDVVARALPLVRAHLPDVRWTVIGDGPLRPALERLVGTHGMTDHVEFLGAVSAQKRDEWLRRSHVFVMPSRLPRDGAGEGFGIVYLEANAHAMPAIGGNVGGAVDAIVDGETGILVDPNDHVAVARAITELLEQPERAAALGAAGVARATSFVWPRIAERVQRLVLDTITLERQGFLA